MHCFVIWLSTQSIHTGLSYVTIASYARGLSPCLSGSSYMYHYSQIYSYSLGIAMYIVDHLQSVIVNPLCVSGPPLPSPIQSITLTIMAICLPIVCYGYLVSLKCCLVLFYTYIATQFTLPILYSLQESSNIMLPSCSLHSMHCLLSLPMLYPAMLTYSCMATLCGLHTYPVCYA